MIEQYDLNLNHKDRYGFTALQWAVIHSNIAVARLLL
ncbi:ankyrin repeat domain-containing protein [Acerihabitans sp.]